jgi:FkbM family methyltransferase
MYFSQEGQDKFLDTYIFKGFRDGVFVDVGAHDGKSFSNTMFFESERGWSGLLIEPNPTVFERLKQNRPHARAEQCAISESEGLVDFLQITGYSEMLSGIPSAYDPRHKERVESELEGDGGSATTIQVQSKRFSTVARAHNLSRIHYLSIDVEGAEASVLRSIDFTQVFIDVIGFESNYEENTVEIVDWLKSRGYQVIPSNCVDVFMIHTQSPFLKKPPPSGAPRTGVGFPPFRLPFPSPTRHL